VIRLSGVSEPTKQEQVTNAIVARLRTLGFNVVSPGHSITWYGREPKGMQSRGRVIVYAHGNVVGELPAEYYL
jgi:hypothetical protein